MGNNPQKKSAKACEIQYSNGDRYIGNMNNQGHRSGKGTYIFVNGDRYEGDWQNHIKQGNGTFYYNTGELYIGEWVQNKKEGFGKYFYQGGERYIGKWLQNMKNGEGTLYSTDGSYYTGIFMQNKKHGKGFMYYHDGSVFEQEWNHGQLMQSIKSTNVQPPLSDSKSQNTDIQNDHPNEHSQLQAVPFECETLKEQEQIKEYKDGDFKNINSISSNQNVPIGLETLSLIEQIDNNEMIIFDKKADDWSVDDVSQWLMQKDLEEYVKVFQDNHINGKVLFDITEKELKEDFKLTSVGQRKNFIKATQQLQRMQTKNPNYLKKMQKEVQNFIDKKKSQQQKHQFNNQNFNSQESFNNKFNSIQSKPIYSIIEEDYDESQHQVLKYSKIKLLLKSQQFDQNNPSVNIISNILVFIVKKSKSSQNQFNTQDGIFYFHKIKFY